MRKLTRALLVTLPLATSGLLFAADGPANRTDVFYTLDFESISPVTNPDNWQAGMSDTHDGLFVDHIARYEQPQGDGGSGSSKPDGNRTAAVRSLPHVQVIANGKNPSPLTGTNYLKGTLYIRPNDLSGYTVNYSPINGNRKDKPRINLRTRKAIEAEFKRDNSHAAYRQNQYWCFDVGLPADFHEAESRRMTLMQVVSPVSTPENNIDLSIVGQRGGSVFQGRAAFCARTTAGDGKAG